jgi:hypothetical protein
MKKKMTEDKYKRIREYLEPKQELSSLDVYSDEEIGPEPVYWRKIDAMVFPDDRWLVKDILPKEGLTILASISGEGKSLVIMHLAKCLTEGSAWFGHGDFKAVKSRVLYINLEMSESEMQRRGRLIGLDPMNEDLFILNIDNFNLNDTNGEDADYRWLLQYIMDNRINVVIIDTFRPASGGLKEDKAEDVRAFLKKFQLLKNCGVSIIFTEHLRKPNQNEGKIPKKEQLLGSQDKTANLEVLLMLKKDESTGEIHIYQRKNRLGPEHKPFGAKVSDILDSESNKRLLFEYVGEIDDDVNKKETAKVRILEMLSTNEVMTTPQIIEILKKEVGEKNTRKALRELSTQNEVTKSKVGRKDGYLLPREDTEIPQEWNFNNESDSLSELEL